LAEIGRPIPADQIASELAVLARGEASGALEINGQPGGIVYLSAGRLTFAESPAVPDLGARLIRSGRIQPDVWDQLARESRPDGAIAGALVARGIVTAAGLQRLLQSITLDALLALTTPFAGECAVAGIWFAPQRSHWAEAALAMDVAFVRTYLDHMTQRLAWYDIPARGCPRLTGAGHPEGLVHRDQRAIVGQIDGRTTVAELAWRGGFALHETVESIGRLVHAGMCTVTAPDTAALPDTVPAADTLAAPDTVSPVAGEAGAGQAVTELPRRGPDRDDLPADLARATPLDLGLLQRVRQALQHMS
jgi:hypothetical protein